MLILFCGLTTVTCGHTCKWTFRNRKIHILSKVNWQRSLLKLTSGGTGLRKNNSEVLMNRGGVAGNVRGEPAPLLSRVALSAPHYFRKNKLGQRSFNL